MINHKGARMVKDGKEWHGWKIEAKRFRMHKP